MTSNNTPDYLSFDTEALLTDDRFVAWVQLPTTAEDDFWAGLAKQDARHAGRQREARELLQQLQMHYSGHLPSPAETERAYVRWAGKPKSSTASWVISLPTKLAIAASLLLIVSLGTFLYLNESGGSDELHYQTAYGERMHLVLPDATEVDLNANSELTYYHTATSGAPRRAVLKGEAFFHVAKDPDGRGFEVTGNDLLINVLGTQFNVYARDQASVVTLEEGSVRVDYANEEGDKEPILMQPGERVSYSSFDQEVINERVAVQPVIAWKDGFLVFRDQSLGEATNRLEEIFGVTIVYENENMKERPVHLSTSADKLDVFFTTLDKLSPRKLVVQRKGDTIRLSEAQQ